MSNDTLESISMSLGIPTTTTSTAPMTIFLNNMTGIDDGSLSNKSLMKMGDGPSSPMLPNRWELDMGVQIGLYSAIFLLAVLGNVLVILTLVQNQGMRTITNLFLLNLAIADLLVGVFCMPFTLVGIILKDFVFGDVLCKLIPYLQAVSVSVSAWTLVAISVERYYAICHPLTSRRWQTLSHAYKIIAIVWILSLFCMLPITFVSLLKPIRKTGRHKCREEWPDETLEKTYTLFLDTILLVLPLVIMTVKYSLITRTLWPAASNEPCGNDQNTLVTSGVEESGNQVSSPSKPQLTVALSSNSKSQLSRNSTSCFTASFRRYKRCQQQNNTRRNSLPQYSTPAEEINSQPSGQQPQIESSRLNHSSPLLSRTPRPHLQHSVRMRQQTTIPTGGNTPGLRRCNVGKSLKRKKRVIQMLGVVVAEFFVCWAPLYVMNTWYLFSPTELYEMIGPLGVSLIQLLAYISSCSNPITYCFMNGGFRIAFCRVFGCHCGARSASNRNDSVRLTRNRSLYSATYNRTSEDV